MSDDSILASRGVVGDLFAACLVLTQDCRAVSLTRASVRYLSKLEQHFSQTSIFRIPYRVWDFRRCHKIIILISSARIYDYQPPMSLSLLSAEMINDHSANIESSDVWGTSCLLNKLIYLIHRQFLCGKCSKRLTIQYLRVVAGGEGLIDACGYSTGYTWRIIIIPTDRLSTITAVVPLRALMQSTTISAYK